MRCPNCGQENPAGARFCFSCGKPFDDAPAREERKVITVVFADLVGFTSRAEQAVTDVAAAQLYAARKLVEAGRRPEAELYLQPALSFYRSVDAAHRVRQGEALLAATA